MRRTAKVYQNADGTWTVKVGRSVEHVDTYGKTHGQIFDAVRWALISKNVFVNEVELMELMRSK